MRNKRTGPDYLDDVDLSGAPLDPALYLAWLKKEEEKKKRRAGSGTRKGDITLL